MATVTDKDLDDVEVFVSPLLVPGILLLVAVGGAIDLILDRPERWLSAHVIMEVILMITSLTFSIVLWRGWRATQGRTRTNGSIAGPERG